MLTYLFRGPKHWRPKYPKDLFHKFQVDGQTRFMCRIWQATPDDCKVLNTLGDIRENF